MLVKALIDFGGQYAMHKGDVGELPDNAVTNNLVEEGYIVVVDKAETQKVEDETKADVEKVEEDDTKADVEKVEEDDTKADVEKVENEVKEEKSDDEHREDESKGTRTKGRQKK